MYDEIHIAPNLRPLARDVVGDIGNILWVLLGAVGIVLLVACANIANLFLVRAEGRQQELAIRTALGASRTQVVGRAAGRSRGAQRRRPGCSAWRWPTAASVCCSRSIPRSCRAWTRSPSTRSCIAFVLAASAVAALLFGLLPVAKYANPRLSTTLKEGGRGSSDGRERHRARHTLVVAQVALALVLLVASGLMIRTFLAMRDVQPGFTAPDEIFTMRIAIPETVVKDPLQAAATHEQILRRIEAIPGVTSVGPGLVDADGRHQQQRSGVGGGQARARGADAADPPLQVGDAELLRHDGRRRSSRAATSPGTTCRTAGR